MRELATVQLVTVQGFCGVGWRKLHQGRIKQKSLRLHVGKRKRHRRHRPHAHEADSGNLWRHRWQRTQDTRLSVPQSNTRRPATHTHTHTFNDPFSRTTRVSWYQKGEPIWILLKQQTVSSSGISWAICKSAPRSRQITMPAPHHSVFYRPDAHPAAHSTASMHCR